MGLIQWRSVISHVKRTHFFSFFLTQRTIKSFSLKNTFVKKKKSKATVCQKATFFWQECLPAVKWSETHFISIDSVAEIHLVGTSDRSWSIGSSPFVRPDSNLLFSSSVAWSSGTRKSSGLKDGIPESLQVLKRFGIFCGPSSKLASILSLRYSFHKMQILNPEISLWTICRTALWTPNTISNRLAKYYKYYYYFPHILNNLSIFIPFNSLFWGWKHRIGLLGLFEEASFPATFTLHHQIMFGFMYRWLINILFNITFITGINICPEKSSRKGKKKINLSVILCMYIK